MMFWLKNLRMSGIQLANTKCWETISNCREKKRRRQWGTVWRRAKNATVTFSDMYWKKGQPINQSIIVKNNATHFRLFIGGCGEKTTQYYCWVWKRSGAKWGHFSCWSYSIHLNAEFVWVSNNPQPIWLPTVAAFPFKIVSACNLL